MAIKIIDETPDKSVVKRVICRNCGVKLEYVPSDVQKYSGKDITGSSEGCEWIVCPKCNKDVILRSW